MSTTSQVVSGTVDDAAIARMAASASSSVARWTERRSTWMLVSAATTLGRVPPRTTPAFTGHTRPSAIERVQCHDLVGRFQDRAPTLLGLHPGMRGTARDAQLEVGDALAGADDVAVGAGALHHQCHVHGQRLGTDDGRADRRIRSPRPGWPRTRCARTAAARAQAHCRTQDPQRVQARQQAALHVRDTRAHRVAVPDGERPLRDRARVEHRVHVADQQQRRTAAAAPDAERADDGVAVCLVGQHLDIRAQIPERRRDPAADLVHAGLGVRTAVDVHQALEIGQVCRQLGRHERGEPFESVGLTYWRHAPESMPWRTRTRPPRRSPERTAPSTHGCTSQSPANTIGGRCWHPSDPAEVADPHLRHRMSPADERA